MTKPCSKMKSRSYPDETVQQRRKDKIANVVQDMIAIVIFLLFLATVQMISRG